MPCSASADTHWLCACCSESDGSVTPRRATLPPQLTGIKPEQVDILITNCSIYCPTPSIASMLINMFKMREDIQVGCACVGCARVRGGAGRVACVRVGGGSPLSVSVCASATDAAAVVGGCVCCITSHTRHTHVALAPRSAH
jgi:hypothetical protein